MYLCRVRHCDCPVLHKYCWKILGHHNNVERSSDHSGYARWCPPVCLYLESERPWPSEIFVISNTLQLGQLSCLLAHTYHVSPDTLQISEESHTNANILSHTNHVLVLLDVTVCGYFRATCTHENRTWRVTWHYDLYTVQVQLSRDLDTQQS